MGGKRIQVSPGDLREMALLAAWGFDLALIGKMYAVGQTSVRRVLEKNGFHVPKKIDQLDPDTLIQILHRFLVKKEPVAEIARWAGVSTEAVRATLRRRGHRSPRPTGEKSNLYRGGPTNSPRAHLAVWRAKNRGLLSRPERCSACKSTKCLHAHHDDYNKPLEVRWLCVKCHREWHKHNRAIPRQP